MGRISKKRIQPLLSKAAHKTKRGSYWIGRTEALLSAPGFLKRYEGKVDLILTSPPFPLNKKKRYGNLQGEEYLKWMESLAPKFERLLSPTGSLVIELGNSWEPKRPVQSLLALQALLALASREEEGGLRLIQEFICYNPSRLPSPAQWVTVERVRTVDSFTHVWWLAKTDHPDADNSRVPRPYSSSMLKLLDRRTFNHGTRPSQHKIAKRGFLKKHKGSIAHNVFELESIDPSREVRLPNAFSFSNTISKSYFDRTCKEQNIIPHPARMPLGLAAFFVHFLTRPNGLVLDPFAGSNTTGFMAESLGRRWIAVDANPEFVKQSRIRFSDPILKERKDGTRSRIGTGRSLQTEPAIE